MKLSIRLSEIIKRKIFLVLGCHRSGTSALTRVLNLQGAKLPKTLMKSQPDNPDGFFESQPIVQFNDALLKSADRSWFDPRPIDEKWFKDPGKRLHRVEQAKKLLAQEFPDGDLLVLKDPRICRLLPIWLTALEQSNLEAIPLIITRNPLEVSASLNTRNRINKNQSHLLWLEYILQAEKKTRHLPRAIFGFDDLLEDWRSVLIDCFDALGIESIDLTSNSAHAIDQFLVKDKKHFCASTDQLLKDKSISALVKKSWVAFQAKPISLEPIFDDLNQEYENLSINLGNFQDMVTMQKTLDSEKGMDLTNAVDHRHIILHYHLFKNAGTSLDKILKENFKEGWHEYEGPSSGWKSCDVATYLEQNKYIKVLSSHTALLPVPEIPNTTIYPIIFIRHPIDRIRSIYEFERKQIAETEGAIKAKELDLVGYIKWRLSRNGDRTIRNFQCYRFSFAIAQKLGDKELTEWERAELALKKLKFVGVVEKFNDSIRLLNKLLIYQYSDVNFESVQINVTQIIGSDIDFRLAQIKKQIGKKIYDRILSENLLDINLYELAVQKLQLALDK